MPYPTGDTGDTTDTWYFRLKSPVWLIQTLLTHLDYLGQVYAWRQEGTATPQEAAAYFQDMLNSIYPAPIYPGFTMVSYREAVPDNWLVCDGGIYERIDYPELYAALNPVFHLDANQFAVPDLRRKTAYGAGGGWAVGDDVGTEDVTLDIGQIPSHSHTDLGHSHLEGIATPTAIAIGAGIPAPAAIPGIGTTGTGAANLTATGGDGSHTNISPGLIGQWIIYTGL